ncbi:UTRA domain-containing protein [Novosphingobium sp. Rr 2-17]|uniref:UTRA domain-containing protein n=1 Tax=Novosphingobium sp. Rr 2-17 TaxID=555793 RepID=UPI0005BA7D20|nr:UTRA domain-containing protein [Novosphingobium sp. Rr 2-17]
MKRTDGKDEPSLNDRIKNDIEANIMSGAWPPGHRIPYEHELTQQYNCSRMTVSKAIAGLVDRGFVERKKRAGTFVAIPNAHRACINFFDVRTEVSRLGKIYDFDLIERIERKATAFDRSHLDIRAGNILQLACLHFASGKPYALENRIINLEQVPEACAVAFDHEPPGPWLFEHVRWSDARHKISAITADPGLANILQIKVGAACIEIERWTWRNKGSITYVKQIHPAEHYSLSAEFVAR